MLVTMGDTKDRVVDVSGKGVFLCGLLGKQKSIGADRQIGIALGQKSGVRRKPCAPGPE